MNNYIMYGGVAIIIALLIIIVLLIRSRSTKAQSTSPRAQISDAKSDTKSDAKREMKRRQKAANRIQQSITKEMSSRKTHLDMLRFDINRNFENVKNTFVDINIKSSRALFQELQSYFDLHSTDEVLYCRRYRKTFGTDNFFIITQTGFAYAPKKKQKWQLNFEEVKSLSTSDIVLCFNENDWGDCMEVMDCIDFIYDGSKIDNLINILNKFLKDYSTELSILCKAAWEAIDEVALPILPNIIEKIGVYDVNIMKYVRAYYKYLLACDGVNTKQNIQSSLYDLQDLYNEDIKVGEIRLLEAKLLLIDPETDNMEVKKLLDEICGNDKYDNDIKDRALELKLKLEI